MSNIEVVGLGALNVDHLHQVECILEDGETIVNKSVSSPGGSAANTIYGLTKLGVKTGFAGVVGDDTEGKMLLQDFKKVGVDTSQIKVKPRAKTGSVFCLSDTLGRRSLYVMPGANNLLATDNLDLSYINRAKMLHLSSFADDRQFKMSLELMDKGSYQVESSDEGLMTDEIEACFSAVLEALQKCGLPAAEVIAWCAEMLKRDRVGFICDQELRALQERYEAPRPS